MTATDLLRRGLDTLAPGAPADAPARLAEYTRLLRDTNRRHNLIARTDLGAVEQRHLLHCLELARWPIAPGSAVVDWGTGGGLPLIPLAIVFPDAQFVGVDAVEKKVLSVRRFARTLGLTNVDAVHARAEQVQIERSLSVSRATAPLADLWAWHVAQPDRPGASATLRCLKGGDLTEEIADLHRAFPGLSVEQHPLHLEANWTADKCVVCVRPDA
jgi:16S rRNA (guanine527-N7)-methyltransferase